MLRVARVLSSSRVVQAIHGLPLRRQGSRHDSACPGPANLTAQAKFITLLTIVPTAAQDIPALLTLLKGIFNTPVTP